MAEQKRPPRADALRNRQKVLAAAREMFAAEGPSVGLDEIAARAGVGAGTVHRHFPTKDELFKAVIADRLEELGAAAHEAAGNPDPGPAFFDFLRRLAGEARHNLVLTAALTDPTGVGEAVHEAGKGLNAGLATLLHRAQRADAVRDDLSTADLHAILGGILLIEQRLPKSSRGRGLDVVLAGLRA
jgi:AcrR family transcriptional regulator